MEAFGSDDIDSLATNTTNEKVMTNNKQTNCINSHIELLGPPVKQKITKKQQTKNNTQQTTNNIRQTTNNKQRKI